MPRLAVARLLVLLAVPVLGAARAAPMAAMPPMAPPPPPARSADAPPAGVDAPRWNPIGPPGPATVNSLAFDPQRPEIAFAGVFGGGIARSQDAGRTWRTSSEGLTHPDVSGLVVHPRLSRLVYAGNGSSLVRSLDGGGRWSELPVPGSRLASFAPAPTDPSLVYAGTDAGLFVSRDSGDSWRRVAGGGLPSSYLAATLAVDARDPRLLYAGIFHDEGFGLWASHDSGDTWQRRLRTVPLQLICDPQRGGTVYLLKFGILQRSRDQGVTWEAYFSAGLALGLVFDPRHPWVAYVASYGDGSPQHPAPLYATSDDGGHWQGLTAGLPRFFVSNALALSPAGTLLFSSDLSGGFYRSADRGASWALAGAGLVNAGVRAVAFGAPGTLFASTGPGVARTRDDGATWSPVLQVPAYISALAVDRQHPETLYASTFNPPGVDPTVVWKTTDGGDSWSPLPYPQPAADPYAGIDVVDVAVDPTNPDVLYLAAEEALVGAPNGQGVYRSSDGGQTWVRTTLPALGFTGLAVAPGRPGTVWAIWQSGAYKSTDYGQSWSQALAVAQGTSLHAVAVAPSDPDVVWVIGDDATYRSADGGATWRRLSGLARAPFIVFDFSVHPLAVDPADPYTLYVAWFGGVSRRSLGTGWQDFDAGLVNRDALTVAFDPADPTRLVAGTNGAGVYELRLPPSR